MPQKKVFGRSHTRPSPSEVGQAPLRRQDLVEIILEPLAGQIDAARLEMATKLQELSESIEIIARQVRREIGAQ